MAKNIAAQARDWISLRERAKGLSVAIFRSDSADDQPPRYFVVLNGVVQQLADQAAVRHWLKEVAEIPESRRGREV
jgi:hypothetical protein